MPQNVQWCFSRALKKACLRWFRVDLVSRVQKWRRQWRRHLRLRRISAVLIAGRGAGPSQAAATACINRAMRTRLYAAATK